MRCCVMQLELACPAPTRIASAGHVSEDRAAEIGRRVVVFGGLLIAVFIMALLMPC